MRQEALDSGKDQNYKIACSGVPFSWRKESVQGLQNSTPNGSFSRIYARYVYRSVYTGFHFPNTFQNSSGETRREPYQALVHEKSLLPPREGGERPLPARGMVTTSPPSSILHGWERVFPTMGGGGGSPHSSSTRGSHHPINVLPGKSCHYLFQFTAQF